MWEFLFHRCGTILFSICIVKYCYITFESILFHNSFYVVDLLLVLTCVTNFYSHVGLYVGGVILVRIFTFDDLTYVKPMFKEFMSKRIALSSHFNLETFKI